ncbi:MAG: alpha/beta hydrolase, partial [Clostridia bacterium]|nr:alpha/beta hydrolase [Clostridia bacterium]
MEYYIAKLSETVQREHVFFLNRFGIQIAADLYTAKDLNREEKHPAIVVGPPYGGVKEQGPCVWADELAQRGFVVLAFDQPFMGESGGEPRRVSSPELFTETFSACVDYLGLQPFVD